ncbi:hypothetical protein chiPu_0011672 [Chiloscyllium punctatum]|uniref:Uncharacterized protein n=1 Tax=Chiloscyllium punctatum TaxID=137246 RepID=A0A401SS24_CHIPU|nr:hypothetical protein [Chiloscyllium punctatum]
MSLCIGSNGTSQVPLRLPGTNPHLRGSTNQPDPFLLPGYRAHPTSFIRFLGSHRSVYPVPGLEPLRLSGSRARTAPFIRFPGSHRSVYPVPGLEPLRLSGSWARTAPFIWLSDPFDF